MLLCAKYMIRLGIPSGATICTHLSSSDVCTRRLLAAILYSEQGIPTVSRNMWYKRWRACARMRSSVFSGPCFFALASGIVSCTRVMSVCALCSRVTPLAIASKSTSVSKYSQRLSYMSPRSKAALSSGKAPMARSPERLSSISSVSFPPVFPAGKRVGRLMLGPLSVLDIEIVLQEAQPPTF